MRCLLLLTAAKGNVPPDGHATTTVLCLTMFTAMVCFVAVNSSQGNVPPDGQSQQPYLWRCLLPWCVLLLLTAVKAMCHQMDSHNSHISDDVYCHGVFCCCWQQSRQCVTQWTARTVLSQTTTTRARHSFGHVLAPSARSERGNHCKSCWLEREKLPDAWQRECGGEVSVKTTCNVRCLF